MWKSSTKRESYSYGKINIFSVKSTILLNKLLKRWFHEKFWVWSHFIVLFHNFGIWLTPLFHKKFREINFLLKNCTLSWFDKKNCMATEFLIFPQCFPHCAFATNTSCHFFRQITHYSYFLVKGVSLLLIFGDDLDLISRNFCKRLALWTDHSRKSTHFGGKKQIGICLKVISHKNNQVQCIETYYTFNQKTLIYVHKLGIIH